MDNTPQLCDLTADVPLIVEYLLLQAGESLADGDIDAADELCTQAERLAGVQRG